MLLVDDSASNLKLYRHFLKAVHCVTDTAEDGVEAVAKATATCRDPTSATQAGSGLALNPASADAVAITAAAVPSAAAAAAAGTGGDDAFYLPYHVIIMDGRSPFHLLLLHGRAACFIMLTVLCTAAHSAHAQYGWFASHTAN